MTPPFLRHILNCDPQTTVELYDASIPNSCHCGTLGIGRVPFRGDVACAKHHTPEGAQSRPEQDGLKAIPEVISPTGGQEPEEERS